MRKIIGQDPVTGEFLLEPKKPDSPIELWVVTHHRRHGHDAYIVESTGPPTIEQAVAVCSIDHEPELEEEGIAIQPAKIHSLLL